MRMGNEKSNGQNDDERCFTCVYYAQIRIPYKFAYMWSCEWKPCLCTEMDGQLKKQMNARKDILHNRTAAAMATATELKCMFASMCVTENDKSNKRTYMQKRFN